MYKKAYNIFKTVLKYWSDPFAAVVSVPALFLFFVDSFLISAEGISVFIFMFLFYLSYALVYYLGYYNAKNTYHLDDKRDVVIEGHSIPLVQRRELDN